MEDILDVYQRPYDPLRPVVCIDELSKQLTKEIRLSIAAEPGETERYDTQYERNGTANIFIHAEPLEGKRSVQVTASRKRIDFAYFLKKLVDVDYPHAEKIVVIMDNLNTHGGASLYEVFPPKEAKRILDQLEIHYTPKHGSWLNIAEIEFSHLSRQCLDRRIPDQETLIQEVKIWEYRSNKCKTPVNWRFKTADARIKLKRLYPTTDENRGQI